MLPHVLASGLKAVVCGTAAGTMSAAVQAYYANPSNKFWKTLAAVGLTPAVFQPQHYKQLIDYRIGLTDLVPHKAGMDKSLKRSDYDLLAFEREIFEYQPRIVCFNGKRAAEVYLQHPVKFGLQSEIIGKTQLFVAPSTSSAANSFWNIDYWHELARLCG